MSDASKSVVKQRVRLHPNNAPSGGAYSASAFPAINFVIGTQRAFLDPRTLRLNGKLTIKNNAGAPIANDNTQAQSATNGATMNNSIGVSSIFEECNISTLNGRNLETIRNYNRYLSTTKPLMNTSMDYNNGLGLKDPMTTDKSLTNQKTANVEHDFSIPIECGMFEGGGRFINLSEKGFHGLQIDFLLAQNAAVIQPYYAYNPAKSTTSATATFNYEVKDLTLTFDLKRPGDKLFQSLPSSGILNYNTISTLHSTLLSSDQTMTMRFGSSNVVSVTHSMVPSLWVNNIAVDSFQNLPPQIGVSAAGASQTAKVRSVQYMRGGQLYPYNFMLDSEKQADLDNVGNPAPQAQIMKPYLNSVSLYDNRRNKLNTTTNVGIFTSTQPAGSDALPIGSAPDPKTLYGLGVPMDTNRQGVSFANVEYAVRLQSELNDTDANAFYTFTRVRNVAQFSPQGINVVE